MTSILPLQKRSAPTKDYAFRNLQTESLLKRLGSQAKRSVKCYRMIGPTRYAFRSCYPGPLDPLELFEGLIPIIGQVLDIAKIAVMPALIQLCVNGIE